jgi:DNA-binding transcriptional ArsR family regulator
VSSFGRVLEALDRRGCMPPHLDGRPNGRAQVMVRCPAHDDRQPSLAVKEGDGQTLMHCFAGCETTDVLDELGLEWPDVFDNSGNGFVSSTYEKRLDESNSPRAIEAPEFEFVPLQDALEGAPEEPDWVWRGYLAPGAISLLAGRPKVGKSTIVFGLLAALVAGRPFLDLQTRESGVLLLSEEREGTLAEKQRRFDLGGRIDLLMRHQARGETWDAVVDRAIDHACYRDLGLLVVDTFNAWTGLRGDEESKAGAVLEALEPLTVAAGHGLTVLVVAHQRKAQGAYGEAVRGSNALTGGVDVVIELERAPSELGAGARVLRAVSRYGATPEELAAELDGETYSAKGDLEHLSADHERGRVLEAVGPAVEMTIGELAEQTGIPKGTVGRRLEQLREDGTLERCGAGKKGDPYRFRRPGFDSSTPPPIAGRNEFEPATPEQEALAQRLLEEAGEE